MDALAATLAAFRNVEDALALELARTLSARQRLRRLVPAQLLARAAEREAFDAALRLLLARARAALHQLCGGDVDALTRRDPGAGNAVAEALAAARRAAASLRQADTLDRGIAQRALAVVRTLSSRLPAPGAAYGPRGAPTAPEKATTTRRTA